MLLIFAAHLSAAEETITELETFEVSHSVKGQDDTRRLPVAAQTFTLTEIDRRNTASIKDVSSLVPNFHLPDYGTQMTASIYVRGFGTRIDHPVVSMIVDDVPLLNKNTFDFDLFDLSRADFLRGPQGTLYGRNAMCGLIHLRTISPFSFQGSRFSADFSTGTTVKAKASTYRKKNDGFAYSVAAHFMHTNGFFENMLKDEKCDPSNGLTVRSRQMWKNNELRIENAVSAGVLEQGGYAYANVTDNKRQPIAYNDICRYDRINITDGLP